MATFYERACKFGSYGTALDLDAMQVALVMYSVKLADAATVAAQCTIGPPTALTAPQIVELNTLLATAPQKNYQLSPGEAFQAATWTTRIINVFKAARASFPGFTTEALVKKALGV